jgi:hypothetical protein
MYVCVYVRMHVCVTEVSPLPSFVFVYSETVLNLFLYVHSTTCFGLISRPKVEGAFIFPHRMSNEISREKIDVHSTWRWPIRPKQVVG